MDILDVMARRPNVCKYLDIALQHSSDKMLKAMRRHISAAETERLLDEIRRRVPGIRIRTTLMVGFRERRRKISTTLWISYETAASTVWELSHTLKKRTLTRQDITPTMFLKR